MSRALTTHDLDANETHDIGPAVDAWLEALPRDPYGICPCGCGMKLRFAMKEGIEQHEQRFIAAWNLGQEDKHRGNPV